MGKHLHNVAARHRQRCCTNSLLTWQSYNKNLENTEPEIWLDTGWELFLFLFNNDCIILTLVITGWESELRVNGTALILQKYKSTFMP